MLAPLHYAAQSLPRGWAIATGSTVECTQQRLDATIVPALFTCAALLERLRDSTACLLACLPARAQRCCLHIRLLPCDTPFAWAPTLHKPKLTCVCWQSQCHGMLQFGCQALLAAGLADPSAECSGSPAGCAASRVGSTPRLAAPSSAALQTWGIGHTRASTAAAAAATAAASAVDPWVQCCCCWCRCCLHVCWVQEGRPRGMGGRLRLPLLLHNRGWAAGVKERACRLPANRHK
jgi:hypothetical protein